jgi:cytochrome P450
VIEEAARKAKPFPKVGLADNLRFNLGYVLPNILQGAFLRRPGWVRIVSALRRGFLSAGLGPRFKAKYGREGVCARFLVKPSMVLFDQEAIQHVLKNSPSIYGAPAAKQRGMSHFQPGAVTISHGHEWEERRRFNEAVLYPREAHPLAAAIHAVVREEARTLFAKSELRWDDFAGLFERITLRTMFGRAGESERHIALLLKKLMRRANLPFLPRRERLLRTYRSQLEEAIRAAEPSSLAALARGVPDAGKIPVAAQMTHWLFAMNDTLGENAVRAAGVIHALEPTRLRALDEVKGKDLDDPATVTSLRFVAACLEEAMRLWPSTPFLLREAVDQDTLCGHRVKTGDQVVIPNLFNHVDPTTVARATEWFPERWLQDGNLPRFYHFSDGRQSCPGADLARFIGTGVLATLIAEREFHTLRPRILNDAQLPAAFNPFAIHLADLRQAG